MNENMIENININNKKIVLQDVKYDGLPLQFASDELKNNKEIMTTIDTFNICSNNITNLFDNIENIISIIEKH